MMCTYMVMLQRQADPTCVQVEWGAGPHAFGPVQAHAQLQALRAHGQDLCEQRCERAPRTTIISSKC